MVGKKKTRITIILSLLSSVVFLLIHYIQTSNVKLNSQFNQTCPNNQLSACAEDASHQATPIQLQDMSEEFRRASTLPKTKLAVNSRVVIVAHGRSGASFLGGVFNSHPDFFYIFEPLNQLKKIVDRFSKQYLHHAEDVVNSILNCHFTNEAFLRVLSQHSIYRASSRSLVSPPFCKTRYDEASNFLIRSNWKLCNEAISTTVLNELCGKHKNIATKILLECLPADLTWLVNINRLSSVKVLYLVRDPRAMLYSRYRLGWVVSKKHFMRSLANGKVTKEVRKVCNAMEINLGAVLRNPQNIKLIRFEELVANPETIVRDVFSQLGISMQTNVLQWIHETTKAKGSRDSINAWRKEINHQYLQIIERECERVLRYLGYIPTHGSRKILSDLNRPLHLKEMRDLKETYQW